MPVIEQGEPLGEPVVEIPERSRRPQPPAVTALRPFWGLDDARWRSLLDHR